MVWRASSAGLVKRDMTTKLFKARYPKGVPEHYLELRTYRDTLSLELQRIGYLEDCLTLLDLPANIWEFFIDVGANVGACSIPMAASGMTTLALSPCPVPHSRRACWSTNIVWAICLNCMPAALGLLSTSHCTASRITW